MSGFEECSSFLPTSWAGCTGSCFSSTYGGALQCAGWASFSLYQSDRWSKSELLHGPGRGASPLEGGKGQSTFSRAAEGLESWINGPKKHTQLRSSWTSVFQCHINCHRLEKQWDREVVSVWTFLKMLSLLGCRHNLIMIKVRQWARRCRSSKQSWMRRRKEAINSICIWWSSAWARWRRVSAFHLTQWSKTGVRWAISQTWPWRQFNSSGASRWSLISKKLLFSLSLVFWGEYG